jgi:hypothetical protein
MQSGQSTSAVKDWEKEGAVSAAHAVDAQLMLIRPCLGTGWETTVSESTQEVRLRFKLVGLPLPIKKRVPFSEVAHVAVVCRESWWSWAGGGWSGWAGIILFGMGSSETRSEMPTKGWRYDLLMDQKGGHKTRLEVLKSSDAAYDLVGQLRQRLGLPSVN